MWEKLQGLVLPDSWQSQGIQALQRGRDVVIDAPTGAGKTYVFEKYIERAHLSRQAIYTVPTRALANDKYAEWKSRGWRVGIRTGDLSIDSDAPTLVATLEAVQSLATWHPAAGLLVVDEYQWLGDAMRGNHYEGVVLSLPPSVRILLLSGCVANPEDVAAWLKRLGREVEVVRLSKRPVPLEEHDVDRLSGSAPPSITGYWTRRLYGALREDLGPVLVFAPHRQEAERLARQASRELPLGEPLSLSPAQLQLAGPELAKMLVTRVAYHHSGLTYTQRAGLIEPLAKAGQLRAVFATLGLSAGINFSLRSVMVTGDQYNISGIPHNVQPHELLQMAGRAGRRGLDQVGYFLITSQSPRLSQARSVRLRRSTPLPWAFLLRRLDNHEKIPEEARRFGQSLFTTVPPMMGLDKTGGRRESDFPCHLWLDTSRARLVRRSKNPSKICPTCPLRPECLELNAEPTLLWQWHRIGLLDRSLHLTPRGRIAASFLGAEGLALAAALENKDYSVQDLVFDCANLFAGDRFAGSEPRWAGRLAESCRRAYGRFSIEGYLAWGVPVNYGNGGSDIVQQVLNRNRRKSQISGLLAGVGDIDRLLTEWRSFLRQISEAPDLDQPRWQEFQREAREWLKQRDKPVPFDLPQLTPAQKQSVSHVVRLR